MQIYSSSFHHYQSIIINNIMGQLWISIYNNMLIKRIRNISTILFHRCLAYHISAERYKKDILGSQFHQQGIPELSWQSISPPQAKREQLAEQQERKGRRQEERLEEGGSKAFKDAMMGLLLKLQEQRLKIIPFKITILTNLKIRQAYMNHLQEYTSTYSQLISLVTANLKHPKRNKKNLNFKKFPAEYKNPCLIYRIIGWYNITDLYMTTLSHLFSSTSLENIKCLLQALSYMHFYQKVNTKQLRNISQFYQTLDRIGERLQMRYMKMLQKVQNSFVTTSKQNFYSNYSKRLYASPQLKPDNIQLCDLVWLYRQYIQSMNDDPALILTFEKYIMTHKKSLMPNDLDNLMAIYTLKGKINQQIYRQCIRPYILGRRLGSMRDLAVVLKFIICSEVQDYDLLRWVYSLINQQFNKSFESAQDYYQIHMYSHYLRIKGFGINFGDELQRKLNQTCRSKSQKSQPISHLVISNQLKDSNGKKYISKCLQTKALFLKQYNASTTSIYQSIFQSKISKINLKDTTIYKKPHFCGFQLDYLLSSKPKKEYLNIEIQGMQYRFASGGLIRQRQIRNDILRHYNIGVEYIRYEQRTDRVNLTDREAQIIDKFTAMQ